jgi:hypothetical protein
MMTLANTTVGSLVPRVRQETLYQAHQIIDPSLLHNTIVTPPAAVPPISLIVDIMRTKLLAQTWSSEEVRGESLPGRQRSTATRASAPNQLALSPFQAAENEAPLSPREENKK